MLRSLYRSVWLSSLLLATGASVAAAQGVEITNDSTNDSTHASALPQRDGRNWFVSLLRKIGRRRDEPVALGSAPLTAADTETVSESSDSASGSVVPMRTRAERSFKSRKDSLEWRSARSAANRS